MHLAFSQVKQNLITVEEYLEWQGDDNDLAAKNQLICPNCGSPVFMKRGPVRKPHFSHFKADNDITKECPVRVESLERDPQLMLRRVQAFRRFNVAIFNQRAEEYLCLGILEHLKQMGIPLIYFSKGVLTKTKVDNENQGLLMEELFDLLETSKEIRKHPVNWLESEAKKALQWTVANASEHSLPLSIQAARDETDHYLDGWWANIEKGSRNDAFTLQLYKQLLNQTARPVMRSFAILCAVIHIAYMLHKFEDKPINSCFEEFSKHGPNHTHEILYFLARRGDINKQAVVEKTKTAEDYVLELVHNLKAIDGLITASGITQYANRNINILNDDLTRAFNQKRLKLPVDIEIPEEVKEILELGGEDFFDQHVQYKNLIAEMDNEIFSSKLRKAFQAEPSTILGMLNLPEILKDYYGDNFNSEAEAKLRPYSNDRGCLYVASIGVAAKDDQIQARLAKMGRTDVVKIGKSKNPQQRERSLGGQVLPRGAVKIEMNFVAMQMGKTEKFIHKELKQYRLFPDRELFALSTDEAIQLVEELVAKYESKWAKASKKVKPHKVFGMAA